MHAALRECKCLPWQMSSLACHGCSQELLASFRTIRDGGRDPNNLPYLGTHRAKELLQLADVTLRSRWRPWLLAGAVPWLRLPVRIAAGAAVSVAPHLKIVRSSAKGSATPSPQPPVELHNMNPFRHDMTSCPMQPPAPKEPYHQQRCCCCFSGTQVRRVPTQLPQVKAQPAPLPPAPKQ